MARILIVVGIALVVLGLAWPWLARIPLGRLPGDIVIDRGGSRFYFPVTTCILLSLIVTAILWFFRR